MIDGIETLACVVQVRSLAEASSGGDRQIQALQKELAAVRQVRGREGCVIQY